MVEDCFFVVDLETANKDPGSICQIGIAFVQGRRLAARKSLLINPGMRFDNFNMSLHGITPRNVESCNSLEEVYPKLRALLQRHTVYHHSPFEIEAITSASRRCSFPADFTGWKDSIQTFRSAWPGLESYSLAALAELKSIRFRHHNAMHDAIATAYLLALAGDKPLEEMPPELSRIDNKIQQSGVLVITGETATLRADIENQAELMGFSIGRSVTKKTTHVLCGTVDQRTIDAGRKISLKEEKARALISEGQAIKLLDEDEFLRMANSASS